MLDSWANWLEDALTNAETERVAIEYVMALERKAGRQPEDVRRKGMPFDISSPPRKIEVKSFGRSARGDVIALEDRQYQAARADPENFYIYVVDNVSRVSHFRGLGPGAG
jgi:hypothetical protein